MKYNASTLRSGFTTGSAAAAAAKAAVLYLLAGEMRESINIPLPPGASQRHGNRLEIPLERVWLHGPNESAATVIKDGGDDPDATHNARITCRVRRGYEGEPNTILIDGGQGVGRVTLPGLPVPVGQAAINPSPMAQIQAAIQEASNDLPAIHCIIEVERGEEIAQKTLNPRLGILGGISILGTSGVVVPYSSEAWKAAIEESLSVAHAQGISTLFLTTGRKSERFLMAHIPNTPELACVHMADYVGSTLEAANRYGFHALVFGLFFGKLVKMSQQHAHTHAHVSQIDFQSLAQLAKDHEYPHDTREKIAHAVTARHVLELISPYPQASQYIAAIGTSALTFLKELSPLPKRLVVFDFDGNLLLDMCSLCKK